MSKEPISPERAADLISERFPHSDRVILIRGPMVIMDGIFELDELKEIVGIVERIVE